MGTTQREKEEADAEFKYNMYALIRHQGGWLQYKWNSLKNARKRLANVFFWAVDKRGDDAYWAGKERPS